MIFLNKNKSGKLYVLLFGIACLLDGFIILLSLGYLSGKFCLTCDEDFCTFEAIEA